MEKQGGQNHTVRDVNAAQRVTMAVKLRAQRVKYEDIARICGYGSAGAAHKAIQRELERTVASNVEELRREELESLDKLEMECWKIFQDKARAKGQLYAVDRILSIKDRRSKMLGLDVSKDTVIGAQVVVREVPPGYLSAPSPQEPTS
jgi:Na+-transporting NADH:ubiquinone oxidoreductase subunit NqrC